MIDSGADSRSDWLAGLRDIVRGSVHETRNALNGLLVNLEVVRSRLARSAPAASEKDDVLPFAEHATSQAEAAAKLSEGVGALLALIAASVDEEGRLGCSGGADSSTIRFEVDTATAERLVPRLEQLGARAGFVAESDGGAVILSFPKTSR
ncbi:MAG: hypothetical protein ABR582_11615 [Gemmatimonadaceae bacterium]